MKRTATYFTFLFLFLQTISAQVTVADDWTKTDCDAVEHNLYSELDEGKVIVMEMVMLESCVPCITAALLMQPIITQFNENYDNRIQWYTLSYNDSYSCEELQAWKAENIITCGAQFTEGEDQIDFYGGMGMPTVVVLGRNTHTVYFNKFGFTPFDTVPFADALTYALGLEDPVSVIDDAVTDIHLFPNPTSNLLYAEGLESLHDAEIHIYNTNGTLMMSENGLKQNQIAVNHLAAGLYYLQIVSQSTVYQASFIKQ